jgi:hypothetical protein
MTMTIIRINQRLKSEEKITYHKDDKILGKYPSFSTFHGFCLPSPVAVFHLVAVAVGSNMSMI